MRYLVGLFGVDEAFKSAYQEKISSLQESGKVNNDFETTLNGHTVKMYLPNDVREQYRLLLMAESFTMKDYLFDDNKIIELRFKLFDEACKRLLIDGDTTKKYNDIGLGVDVIDTLVGLYLTELLLPLYHWSSTKVKNALTASLNITTSK